ncbi:MAG TPA: 50S ribosomal protein L21 [Candidatus Limnocylindrales bacterium]|nr:50S ribosomal protein L21 [Candidatus Limnocylindrales bacterium]
MYAVIETGGKQYRVELGTQLAVERLDVEPGASITLDRVLLVADGEEATVGRPLVTDAAVAAEVVTNDRADKVIVFKYRPKARRRVKKGHRQERTVLRISDIRFNGRSAADDARAADERARTERQRLQDAAARQAAEDAALAEKLAKRAAPAPEPAAKPSRSKAALKAGSTGATEPAAPRGPAKPKRARAAHAESPAVGEAETTETTETTPTAVERTATEPTATDTPEPVTTGQTEPAQAADTGKDD